MKSLVIFDMDGTLADTSPGIIHCHQYAHRMMGRQEPSAQELMGVIGGPLLQTYETRFGFPKEEARKAVDIYRERYARLGIHEARLYEGIPALLRSLKERGAYLGVATLKAERFAKTMLSEMGVAELFDVICGVDERDTRTKAQLIGLCILHTGVSRKNAVLVGDSEHDRKGAAEAGVGFIGVSYGYGFSGAVDADGHPLCEHAADVLRALEKGYLSDLE